MVISIEERVFFVVEYVVRVGKGYTDLVQQQSPTLCFNKMALLRTQLTTCETSE
jgi:hypothetical protein